MTLRVSATKHAAGTTTELAWSSIGGVMTPLTTKAAQPLASRGWSASPRRSSPSTVPRRVGRASDQARTGAPWREDLGERAVA
jgi:hypothetical protein